MSQDRSVTKDLSRQVEEIRESCNMKQSYLDDIVNENQDLRAQLDQSEQSKVKHIEKLEVKLNAIQQTLDGLSERNKQL